MKKENGEQMWREDTRGKTSGGGWKFDENFQINDKKVDVAT